jgi:hypothetical protein
MLDTVEEECAQELEDFALLPHVKCDDGVLSRIREVGERLRGNVVLDWKDLEMLESVRSIVRLCKQHTIGVVWKDGGGEQG